jgi:DNA-binding transcriptional LysR family regulator
MRITHGRIGGMAELTLVGLRVVRQVAAAGSFTRAAEVLGYTQSAVSRQVALMESATGSPIFERGRRGVTLTPAGEVLVRHAADVLAGLAAAELELAGMRDRLAGRLNLGVFQIAGSALAPRAIARVTADHPGLAVRLSEGATPALLRLLRAGRLDVAVIGAGHGLPEADLTGLRSTVLSRGELMVAVPDGHRFQGSVAKAELAGEQWIAGEGGPGEPQFGAWPTLTEPHIAYTARSWSTRFGLVAAGLGLTSVPALALPALPAGVRGVSVVDTEWSGRAAIAATGPAPTPQARTMVEALQSVAEELPGRPSLNSGGR